MADTTNEDVAARIQTPGFTRAQPAVSTLSDPIADTPMVVTLDELRTYDSDPRVTRNPKYDEIKASIRERGLDAPPPITRRPGEPKYIIRNGGNTRLSILRELWSETKDERFFRIRCLFRPWPERGDIVVLTGHLAENDLHGALTFIERALAVEKARLLYETDASSGALSQSELARRLKADGYPITQSQISRMQDTIRHVLPAIPTALYGGLGRDQIERVTALRKASARVHGQRVASEHAQSQFSELFHGVLAQFDGPPESFNLQRVRDELIGQLSSLLSIDYDSLAIEIVDAETRPATPAREELFHVKQSPADLNPTTQQSSLSPNSGRVPPPPVSPPNTLPPAALAADSSRRSAPSKSSRAEGSFDGNQRPDVDAQRSPHSERVRENIITPPEATERVETIRRLVADATGVPVEDFQSNILRPVSAAAGGLHPVSDVWCIEPYVDTVEHLRIHAAQLAVEIAQEVGAAAHIELVEYGIGFISSLPAARTSDSLRARAALMLLGAISLRHLLDPTRPAVDDVRLSEYVGALLMGERPGHRLADLRLTDASLLKLFRLIRLGRRIHELLAKTDVSSGETAGQP